MTSAQLHKLHRRAGVIAVIFIVMLILTGLLLNHTREFNLAGNYIQSEWLLNWYAVAPDGGDAFSVNNNWISRVGSRLYYNDIELPEKSESLLGAVIIEDTIVIAVKDRLLLLTDAGKLIEKLSGQEGVPAGMKAIGVNKDSQLVIDAAHGYYITDINTLEWEEFDEIEAAWSVPVELPGEVHSKLLQMYRGKGLSLERVILDLHSGRILGEFGVYIIDGAALLFLFLGITGAWMFLSGKRF